MAAVEDSLISSEYFQSKETPFIKDLLADHILQYTAVICGIISCKMVYNLSHLLSSVCFKRYSGLSRSQRVEWNNRTISTIHAVIITLVSLHLVFWSNLYVNDQSGGPITLRSSALSTFALGASIGYFLSDLGMIFWFSPSLGGLEYVIHHLLSIVALTYAMLTGEGQFYTFMVLISEITTPSINLRWYLDTAGMKNSRAYLINGFAMFICWMVARILLFIYLLAHVYTHYDQVWQMHNFGVALVVIVPVGLSIMNLAWFLKIVRGLRKTLAKRE